LPAKRLARGNQGSVTIAIATASAASNMLTAITAR
jgi:hypothetical protein